jgi:hypothetical protein
LNAFVVKQSSCAAVPGPTFSGRIIESEKLQLPACGGFELGHYKFRLVLSFDYAMYVIGSDMDRERVPIRLIAAADNCIEDYFSAWLVHLVR